LSINYNAIHILEKNPDKINWCFLSINKLSIHLLENNQELITWKFPSANWGIFEIDHIKYQQLLSNFLIL
jgi:hypothetical protein